MDRDLRESARNGDPLRRGNLLRRAGRIAEALDVFEEVWRAEGPLCAQAGEHLLELVLARPEGERLAHAARLDRLGRAGLAGAGTLLDALFPVASAIVGGSDAMLALRAFLFEAAQTDRPVVLWGESGVGHELAARTLHHLSGGGQDDFHEGYGPRRLSLLRREIEAQPPDGGTLYLSYASDSQHWSKLVVETCRRRNLRLIVGAVGSVEPALLAELNPAIHGIQPLRERFEDLPELVVALFERAGAPEAAAALSPADIKRLEWHDWHSGNVRELANRVSRAVLQSEGSDDGGAQLFQSFFGLPGEVAQHMA